MYICICNYVCFQRAVCGRSAVCSGRGLRRRRRRPGRRWPGRQPARSGWPTAAPPRACAASPQRQPSRAGRAASEPSRTGRPAAAEPCTTATPTMTMSSPSTRARWVWVTLGAGGGAPSMERCWFVIIGEGICCRKSASEPSSGSDSGVTEVFPEDNNDGTGGSRAMV